MSASLLDCPVRFKGEYGATAVETFIEYVNAYKASKNLNDKQCTAELPFLLEGHARAWFQLRSTMLARKGYQSLMNAIHLHFSTVVPPFVLYAKLYEPYTGSKLSVIHFMQHKLEIFAQLPPPHHPDSVKIDMVYGMLPKQFQSMMPRNELYSIYEFIKKIGTCQAQISQQNSLEENQAPQSNSKQTPTTNASQLTQSTGSVIQQQLGGGAAVSNCLVNGNNTKNINAGTVHQRLTRNCPQQKSVPVPVPDSGVITADLNGFTMPVQETISVARENSISSRVGDILQFGGKNQTDTVQNHNAEIEISINDGEDKQLNELKEDIKIEIDKDILDQISSIFGECGFSAEDVDLPCDQHQQLQHMQKPKQMPSEPTAMDTTISRTNKTISIESISIGPMGLSDMNSIVKRNLYTSEVEPFNFKMQAKKPTIDGSISAKLTPKERKNLRVSNRQNLAKRRKTANQLAMAHKQQNAKILKHGRQER